MSGEEDIESPQSRPAARPIFYAVLVLLVGGLIWLGGEMGWIAGDTGSANSGTVGETDTAESSPASDIGDEGANAIKGFFNNNQSGDIITGEGMVVAVLEDDNDGSRHQRLLVDVQPRSGEPITIKISHNIDLADRLPVEKGDRIRFKGQYEWNDQGGVIHWTHHDPQGTHEDGWIEANGKRVG